MFTGINSYLILSDPKGTSSARHCRLQVCSFLLGIFNGNSSLPKGGFATVIFQKTQHCPIIPFGHIQETTPLMINPALGRILRMAFSAIDLGNSA